MERKIITFGDYFSSFLNTLNEDVRRKLDMGQVIREARREEKITQSELGKRIGANKSYISRIENGLIDPTISTFYSIITALGLRIEIVRPVG